jgi:hypothetical protein
MNNNPPLTAKEAAKLTFPCLLEVWCFKSRGGVYDIISHITERGHFATPTEAIWHNAALPSLEIAEAMRKQFAPKSEYPKQMLVWDDEESNAEITMVLADFGEQFKYRYFCVAKSSQRAYQKGEHFMAVSWKHAKPIPEPDPIGLEIDNLSGEPIPVLQSDQLYCRACRCIILKKNQMRHDRSHRHYKSVLNYLNSIKNNLEQ